MGIGICQDSVYVRWLNTSKQTPDTTSIHYQPKIIGITLNEGHIWPAIFNKKKGSLNHANGANRPTQRYTRNKRPYREAI
jgi:hypothetical protein